MKIHSALLTLAMAASTPAAGVQRPPHITGDQLVAELRGGPNARRLFDPYYARGYMAGVADSTQGHTWCAPSGLAPGAVDDAVLDELTTRPAGSMPGIASAMLLDQYSATFPSSGHCSVKPRLSGDEFTAWLVGSRRKPGTEKSQPELLARERYADGYVGGVVDATQGTAWCAPRRIKPSELDAVGYWGLLDRPPGSMPGNAATLLREQFIAKYPCIAKQ